MTTMADTKSTTPAPAWNVAAATWFISQVS